MIQKVCAKQDFARCRHPVLAGCLRPQKIKFDFLRFSPFRCHSTKRWLRCDVFLREEAEGNNPVEKPVLLIVNGLPATGKTTLAKRLAQDVRLPVFSRDGIYETLCDALEGDTSPHTGAASFSLLYYITGSILAAGKSLIVEGFFGRPDLRTAEFVQLQRRYEFVPFQILCKTEGSVLVERFLARVNSEGRHGVHPDLDWLEQNKARLMQGLLSPLALGGRLLEIDTTTPDSFDYAALLRQVRSALS
jgi:predicted kinase